MIPAIGFISWIPQLMRRTDMKVLWICRVLPEGAGKLFGIPEEYNAGWLNGPLARLSGDDEIQLSYLVLREHKPYHLETHEQNGIRFVLADYSSASDLESFFREEDFDVYHVYGIEHSYLKDLIPFLPSEKTLYYIQGLAGEYYQHYFGSFNELYSPGILLRILMQINAEGLRRNAENEREILSSCHYVTGRTEFDHAAVLKAGFHGTYFPMNESLRKEFYRAEKWNFSRMQSHSIFVSQSNYPIKGTYYIIEAVRILKQKYPDVVCEIGGENILNSQGIASRLGINYASFIRKLIHQYGLEEQIRFVGGLDAAQMIHHYQQANVYLLASTIENSPNSLQEAMFLGTPSVSSYVGGVGSLVDSMDQCLLYPYDDIAQCAYSIARIFDSKELAERLSLQGSSRMSELVDVSKNVATLKQIYHRMTDSAS